MKFIFIFFSIWLFSFSICSATPQIAKVEIGPNILSVEIVRTQADQRRGLGYRDNLESDKGMLFLYDNPQVRRFWMKGMRFAIDIIWIRHGKIVHIEKNIPPPPMMTKDSNLKTYGHSVLADSVLEVSAGVSEKLNFSIGEIVAIDE